MVLQRGRQDRATDRFDATRPERALRAYTRDRFLISRSGLRPVAFGQLVYLITSIMPPHYATRTANVGLQVTSRAVMCQLMGRVSSPFAERQSSIFRQAAVGPIVKACRDWASLSRRPELSASFSFCSPRELSKYRTTVAAK